MHLVNSHVVIRRSCSVLQNINFFYYGRAHKIMWKSKKRHLERKWADPLFLLFELYSKILN